jgi:hypothetical protein
MKSATRQPYDDLEMSPYAYHQERARKLSRLLEICARYGAEKTWHHLVCGGYTCGDWKCTQPSRKEAKQLMLKMHAFDFSPSACAASGSAIPQRLNSF